jgi:hypothetical protein
MKHDDDVGGSREYEGTPDDLEVSPNAQAEAGD